MLFRRRAAKKSTAVKAAQKIARAVCAVCEPLEERQLLTALINGKFQGTGTQFDGTPVFEYRQANGNAVIRISVAGNITAEFIGYDNTTGQLVDLQAANATVTTSNVFLFSIYVVKSDMDSTISIANVPEVTTMGGRPMNPFAGGLPLRVTNASTGVSTLLNLADGTAYIGAQTPSSTTAPGNNIPIITTAQRRFGMRPSSAGAMYAGLEVAPGNDLGRFFLGGTITGIVDVPGSMETFYAGNILTGDAGGIGATNDPRTDPIWPDKNFNIGKDIRNVISANSFGTLTLASPTLETIQYKTGFKLNVGGKIGEAFAADSFLGEAVVQNKPTVSGPGIVQREIEVRGSTLPAGDQSYFDPQFFGNDIGIGFKQFDPRFFNDTFATAQFLGVAQNQALSSNQVIVLDGTLGDNGSSPGFVDGVDYYAVPLLAGQTVQVKLKDLLGNISDQNNAPVMFGIFDPYGKLIETNYTKITTESVNSIQFTSSNAGAYRIAIGNFGDVNFNGAADGGEAVTSTIPHPYQLTVTSAGNLAFGGLVARTDIATTDAGNRGLEVDSGDLGAVETNGTIFSESNPWYIPAGNLRSALASSMGILRVVAGGEQIVLDSGPDFMIRKGSIGVLRTTNTSLTTGILMVDDDVQDDVFPSPTSDLNTISSSLAVGKSIQLVDAAANLEGDLLSNGSIGVIRAQDVGAIAGSEAGLASPLPSPVWVANADRSGSDGIIDLIDVTGNFVGPAISTGPQGDVRYLHVGGTLTRDPLFGGGTPEATTFDPGQAVTITDDSGTPITITPTPFTTSSGVAPATPPSISLLTYPIRNSNGGVVIVNLTVNVSTTAVTDGPTTGVDIETGGKNPGAAEIGELDVVSPTGAALGVPITFDPFGRTYSEPATPTTQAIDITMHGKTPINVWKIGNTGAITYDNITNSTAGEIVQVGPTTQGGTLPDVNFIGAAQLGMATSHTGQSVEGATVFTGLEYPFAQVAVTAGNVINADVTDQQRNLIQVGDLSEADSRGGIGNILATNIGTIIAGRGKTTNGIFGGIDAPIVSGTDTPGSSDLTGNIVSLQIGGGILPTGSGDIALSGVFAGGIIDSITGSGDIRGDIVASGDTNSATQTNATTGVTQTTPTSEIGSIQLSGGSIINSNILNTNSFNAARDITQGGTIIGSGTVTTPNFQIGGIRIDGNGGIIGSFIATDNLGLVQINGGFGIVSSEFLFIAGSVAQGFLTDGYGIRASTIQGGADLTQITARGNGKKIPVTAFSTSVRQGEHNAFDPFSGKPISKFNDLDAYLGVSAAHPTRGTITNSGIIEDSNIEGSRDLGNVKAYRIQVRNPVVTDPNTLILRATKPGDPLYPMRISFSDSIGNIQSTDTINGLDVETATLSSLNAGNDVSNALFTIGSRVKSINVAGGLLGSADFEVNGLGGTGIDSIVTKRSLSATIDVQSGSIGTVKVGTDLGSRFFYTQGSLKTLQVNGSIVTGSHVLVRHTLHNLIVGRDLQTGADITTRALVSQDIKGQVLGNIFIK
jgi:hypothetical protein